MRSNEDQSVQLPWKWTRQRPNAALFQYHVLGHVGNEDARSPLVVTLMNPVASSAVLSLLWLRIRSDGDTHKLNLRLQSGDWPAMGLALAAPAGPITVNEIDISATGWNTGQIPRARLFLDDVEPPLVLADLYSSAPVLWMDTEDKDDEVDVGRERQWMLGHPTLPVQIFPGGLLHLVQEDIDEEDEPWIAFTLAWEELYV